MKTWVWALVAVCALALVARVRAEGDIDECVKVTCNSRGVCRGLPGDYMCNCTAGFTGKDCETDIDDCVNVTCRPHSSCLDLRESYACVCDAGYTGDDCQTEIDECVNVTCNSRGVCQDLPGDYRCNCTAGFTGNECETDIDDCVNVTCSNHGVCLDSQQAYDCVCDAGFTGDDCETDIDSCVNVTCNSRGVCLDLHGKYWCDCAQGFIGNDCETDIDECINVTCGIHSKCLDLRGSYECECDAGYTGDDCETDIDECVNNVTCNSRGVCHNQPGAYWCNCTEGYTGNDCETDIDECVNNGTCNSRGVCHNQPGAYWCNCTEGYTGKDCETDKCVGVTCQHEGRCYDGKCICNQDYYGQNCELTISAGDAAVCQKDSECHANATCVDHGCKCLAGLSGDGKDTCNDRCVCRLLGDTMLYLFDGQGIMLVGNHKYTLAKYAGNPFDPCNFNIEVKTGYLHRYTSPNQQPTLPKYIEMLMFGNIIQFGQDHRVRLNGRPVSSDELPHATGDFEIYMHQNPDNPTEQYVILYSSRCDISAGFYGHGIDSSAIVSSSKRFGGSLVGLCGDCDGVPNDLRTRQDKDVSLDDDMYFKISESYRVEDDGSVERILNTTETEGQTAHGDEKSRREDTSINKESYSD